MTEQRKIALITGVTGQDGSFLAEILLKKGYDVHGVVRRSSTFNRQRIEHLFQDPFEKTFYLHYGDLSDANMIRRLIFEVKPDEVYNLAAQSHVRVSFDMPEYTADITALGTLRVLEAIKDYEELENGKQIRFYQASSSEMFGAASPPQNELTPFHPRSPYGVSKVFAFDITRNYREAYNLFAANGILFNHESERRGETFVTRKITRGIARILAGLDKKLYLGNLDAKRDWGYAPEYCEAMWLMLQQEKPDDYVIGTGESHSVREFVEAAFRVAGMPDWEKYVEIAERFYRPSEVDNLIADTKKAREKLGWVPKIKFEDLVKIMVKHDLLQHGLHVYAERIAAPMV